MTAAAVDRRLPVHRHDINDLAGQLLRLGWVIRVSGPPAIPVVRVFAAAFGPALGAIRLADHHRLQCDLGAGHVVDVEDIEDLHQLLRAGASQGADTGSVRL